MFFFMCAKNMVENKVEKGGKRWKMVENFYSKSNYNGVY